METVPPVRVLVWQWGRFGAGPRFGVELAAALARQPGVRALLSLSRDAEILASRPPPACDLPVATYRGLGGYLFRVISAPFVLGSLVRRLAALRPDLAICAMPGPLDLLMVWALRRLRCPYVVIVHDAARHPGDGWPGQMALQRALCRGAAALVALTGHVAVSLRPRGEPEAARPPILRAWHPPFQVAVPPAPPRGDGVLRLLMFGRLLPYKGLDLLTGALRLLGSRLDLEVRVVGSGPDSVELADLRAQSGVTVENRWVPEDEVGSLFAWTDVLVLPYREASQSGVAAIALAAGKRVVATRVGGLAEQLADEPGAVLCDPAPESLAAAIRAVLETPAAAAAPRPRDDGWDAMARSLMEQIRATPGLTGRRPAPPA